jgi:dTDP-4-amino-4,6-dideoxygalactose transaminase
MKMKYRLSQPVISKREINSVVTVLKDEFFGMGTKVKEFESKLSNFLGREALCVSTGTSALQLGLIGAGIKPGDEVLVPSLTFVATYQAISATGAIPISCDINPETLHIDLSDAQLRVTSRTKAIVPVYFAGATNCLQSVYKFAKVNSIRIIEDAAHAFGSRDSGNLVGSIGDISCFSFDGIKNITSGEGGAVVTDDKVVINRIKDARLLGVLGDSEKRENRERSWDFDVQNQGWRYHMSDIFAAIGIVQLDKLPQNGKLRQALFDRYVENLKVHPRIKLFDWQTSNGMIPHVFVLQVVNLKNRNLLREKLEKKGIPTGVHYKPNHLLSFYRTDYILKKTEEIYPELLTLPLHPKLRIKDVNYITNNLIRIIDESEWN